jgi:hypothetical protein
MKPDFLICDGCGKKKPLLDKRVNLKPNYEIPHCEGFGMRYQEDKK